MTPAFPTRDSSSPLANRVPTLRVSIPGLSPSNNRTYIPCCHTLSTKPLHISIVPTVFVLKLYIVVTSSVAEVQFSPVLPPFLENREPNQEVCAGTEPEPEPNRIEPYSHTYPKSHNSKTIPLRQGT